MQNDILFATSVKFGNMSTKIGKYDVLEILGRGGMGVVYKAYDPILDREVALKTMTADGLKDPVLKERFYREARAAGKLRHPNIVTIYELGEESGVPFISMEYLQGTDVHHLIRMPDEVPFDTKIRIVIQLCRGLAYAHRAGIVHRDIKPSNIHLTEDYQVKILDFGIARLVTSTTMTTNGMVLGTIHYMAPEQIKGGHIDRKADIFAAGIIFYEILAHKKPFDGDNTATVLYNILHEPPKKMSPAVDDQFPSLRRILQKSLEKDAAKRYFSADEMADDLEHFLRSYDSTARGSSTVEVEGPQSTQPMPLTEEERKAARESDLAKASAESAPQPPKTPTPMTTDPRAQDFLRTSKRQIAEGHPVQALNSLKEVMKIDPTNVEAGDLIKMVEQDVKRSELEELLKQGQQYMREGRHDIATKAFEKLLKMDPNNTKAKMLLETVKNEMLQPKIDETIANAKQAYTDQKFQLSRKYAEDVLKIAPAHQEAQELMIVLKERITNEEFNELLRSAESFIREQQFETAKKALEKAMKIFPQHPVALKRMEGVNDSLRRQEVEKLTMRGNKQLEMGNYQDANETFQKILELEPNNAKAKMVISSISEKLRGSEIARLLNEGWRTLMMERRYDDAIQIAERVLVLDPNNSEATGLISSARKEKGQ